MSASAFIPLFCVRCRALCIDNGILRDPEGVHNRFIHSMVDNSGHEPGISPAKVDGKKAAQGYSGKIQGKFFPISKLFTSLN